MNMGGNIMVCPKCGNKNKTGFKYCAKCLTLLSDGRENAVPVSRGVTVQEIFVAVVGAAMILSVIFLPSFNINWLNLATAEFRAFSVNIPVDFTEGFKVETNILHTLISMAMIISVVIMLVCSFTKNFQFQNAFAIANIILLAGLFLCMALVRNTFPEEVNMIPNIGFYVYLLLAVIALYSTQSAAEKVSLAEWAGAAVLAVGVVFWLIGYNDKGIDLENLANGVYNSYSQFSSNEMIGIAAVIIGGIITIIGFEMEIYAQNPKKFYYAQTN